MSEVSLNITVNEGKIIFKALTDLPFKTVYELIGKLNEQSNKENTNQYSDEMKMTLKLTKKDLGIITEALSKQPFKTVYGIIEKIYNMQII